MSCGCSKGNKCECGCLKGNKSECCCCLKGNKYECDMSHNYASDVCSNYIHDMCNNDVKDISCNWVKDCSYNVHDMCNNDVKDCSYNVTSMKCKNCNKLFTNSISINKEVCDCSYNYLIYTGDISNVEIELEYSEGPTGATGPTGPVGEIGPTGPSGISNEIYKKTYLSICSMKEQYILVDEPIVFEEHTALMGDCMHISGKSEIYIWKSGYYLINFNVYTLSQCQFSIIKNMLYIVKGSTIGGISGSSQNTHSFIMRITEDDIVNDFTNAPSGKACILCIVNSSSISQGVNLYGSSTIGTPISQITASFTMSCIE